MTPAATSALALLDFDPAVGLQAPNGFDDRRPRPAGPFLQGADGGIGVSAADFVGERAENQGNMTNYRGEVGFSNAVLEL